MPIRENFKEFLEKMKLESSSETYLDLSNQEIDDDEANEIAKFLESHSNITSINLYGNNLGNKGFQALMNVQSLKEIDVCKNKITEVNLESLMKTKVEKLNISANFIRNEGAKALVSIKTLQGLEASECDISEVGANAIFESSSLVNVNLSNNKITDSGLKSLTSNTRLLSLDLSQNSIGDLGASLIAKNSSIQSLDLGSNCIRDFGAAELAKSANLKELILSQNRIGDVGASSFGQNKSIERLVLVNNNISSLSIPTLSNNRKLVELDLSYNKVTDKSESLASIISLRTLNITHNKINNENASKLLETAKKSSIEKIRLLGNPITVGSFTYTLGATKPPVKKVTEIECKEKQELASSDKSSISEQTKPILTVFESQVKENLGNKAKPDKKRNLSSSNDFKSSKAKTRAA